MLQTQTPISETLENICVRMARLDRELAVGERKQYHSEVFIKELCELARVDYEPYLKLYRGEMGR